MAVRDPLNRLNHYGSQAISTVRDLQMALDKRQIRDPKLDAIANAPMVADAPNGQIPVYFGDGRVIWRKVGIGPGDIIDTASANLILDFSGGGGGGTGDVTTDYLTENYYDIGQTDDLLNGKADFDHGHDAYQPRDTQLDQLASLLLDSANAGYRIAVNESGSGFELVEPSTDTAEEAAWITISATGTGASQDITLYETVDQSQVFLWVAGSAKFAPGDFTVTGQTLTGTFTNAAAVKVRYLGTVQGAIPVNSNAPDISGDDDVGATLTLDSLGVWSGTPDSYEQRWTRDNVVIAGEEGEDFLVTTGSDIDADIRCEVRAHNTFGWSDWVASNAVGPIVAAPDLTAPVLDFSDVYVSGGRFLWKFDWPANVYAGYYLHWEFAANNTGDFTVISNSGEHPLTVTDLAGSISIADLAANDGYQDPTGDFSFRAWFAREDGVESPLSNVLTGTVETSVAEMHSTTGANKTQYLNMSGDPVLSGVMNAALNGLRLVRSTVPAANSKFHFEAEIDGIYSGASSVNGSVAIGLCEAYDSGAGTGNLNTSGGGYPSFGVSSNGFTVYIRKGVTTVTVRRNGASVAGTALDAAPAIGDVISIDYDEDTGVYLVRYLRAATGTTKTIASGTLTSFIPAAGGVYACAGGYMTGDAFTANFGADPFQIPESTDHDIFG